MCSRCWETNPVFFAIGLNSLLLAVLTRYRCGLCFSMTYCAGGEELSTARRGWLAGPTFVFEVYVGGFAAGGDESYQSSPDTKRVGLGSCYPTSQKRDLGHPISCGGCGSREAGPRSTPIAFAIFAQGRLSAPLKSAPLRMTRRKMGSCSPTLRQKKAKDGALATHALSIDTLGL